MLPDNGINQLCINGNLVSNKTRMAVDFNRFFKSVFARESIQHEAIPCEDDVNNLTLEQGVLSLLLSLDIKKSSGQVGLPSAFLKRYAEWVAKYKGSPNTCGKAIRYAEKKLEKWPWPRECTSIRRFDGRRHVIF